MENTWGFRGALTIELSVGDITGEHADAIVNAANPSLMGGGGVDGAIHRVGGPKILAECREYRKAHPPLPPGRAIATAAGDLHARYVIHTVGPVWRGGAQGEPETLASCYRECLKLADGLKVTKIAFPSIATGAFGYPVDLAARVAMRAVGDAIQALQHVQRVLFVLFDERTCRAYETALKNPSREHS